MIKRIDSNWQHHHLRWWMWVVSSIQNDLTRMHSSEEYGSCCVSHDGITISIQPHEIPTLNPTNIGSYLYSGGCGCAAWVGVTFPYVILGILSNCWKFRCSSQMSPYATRKKSGNYMEIVSPELSCNYGAMIDTVKSLMIEPSWKAAFGKPCAVW